MEKVTITTIKKGGRGFASMDSLKQRDIAKKGGQTVSRDRVHMALIGKKGGEASHASRLAVKAAREAEIREGEFGQEKESYEATLQGTSLTGRPFEPHTPMKKAS